MFKGNTFDIRHRFKIYIYEGILQYIIGTYYRLNYSKIEKQNNSCPEK